MPRCIFSPMTRAKFTSIEWMLEKFFFRWFWKISYVWAKWKTRYISSMHNPAINVSNQHRSNIPFVLFSISFRNAQTNTRCNTVLQTQRKRETEKEREHASCCIKTNVMYIYMQFTAFFFFILLSKVCFCVANEPRVVGRVRQILVSIHSIRSQHVSLAFYLWHATTTNMLSRNKRYTLKQIQSQQSCYACSPSSSIFIENTLSSLMTNA